ncbi:M20/M25/M40 family metallo-hydrolase [Allosphingosinicella sp.]|uniref:M20/M25/M40 family metallo-hydrolase n=1 Tax=Allosphingosinicella sp. TaxID=2823234 RepID=UPI002FC1BE19
MYLRSVLFSLCLVIAVPASAQKVETADVAQVKEILKRSVGFRTVEGQGQVPAYAAYLASVLKEGGFADSEITITPMGETATLVARWPGTGNAKPIVLLGHMDVVAAKAEDWERDPFTAVEENGYVFGRGAEDNKYDVSMMVATLAQMRRDGFKPERTLILALTGDEETEMATTRALAQQLKGAEMVLNGDGGGGLLGPDGQPVFYGLQGGEKTYADFEIAFTSPGGHSSAPTGDNAIQHLAAALQRVGAYDFPPRSNELTRASLMAASEQVGGEMGAAMARFAKDPADTAAADLISTRPEFIGQVRTTCVATMVDAGHAPNALPQRATANVNCRIFPGVSVESVKAKLTELVADKEAQITVLGDPTGSDASPLRPDVMAAVTKAVHARYPDVAVVPSMSAGATDSYHFRAAGVSSYGVSSLFIRAEDSFAHGLNERVPVAGIGPSLEHWRSLLRDLAQ